MTLVRLHSTSRPRFKTHLTIDHGPVRLGHPLCGGGHGASTAHYQTDFVQHVTCRRCRDLWLTILLLAYANICSSRREEALTDHSALCILNSELKTPAAVIDSMAADFLDNLLDQIGQDPVIDL